MCFLSTTFPNAPAHPPSHSKMTEQRQGPTLGVHLREVSVLWRCPLERVDCKNIFETAFPLFVDGTFNHSLRKAV